VKTGPFGFCEFGDSYSPTFFDQLIWQAIDKDRQQRPGDVSRNTWITGTILDELPKPLQQEKVKSRVA
jgi:hypothetical protein